MSDAVDPYVDAVLGGDFQRAVELYEGLPYPERHPLWARAIEKRTRGRVRVPWRVSQFERFATYWFFMEEGKGAFRASANGRWLLYGFDEHIVVSAEANDTDRRLLTSVKLMSSPTTGLRRQ